MSRLKIYELYGYIANDKPTTFLTPVFRDEEDLLFEAMISDDKDKVSDMYRASSEDIRPITFSGVLIPKFFNVMNTAIYMVRINGTVYAGNRYQLYEILMQNYVYNEQLSERMKYKIQQLYKEFDLDAADRTVYDVELT